jgi:hypothetical protein
MTPIRTLLRRSFSTLLLLAAAAALITAFLVPRLPKGVDVALTFTVPIPHRPPSGEYEFDGFYALQATDLFAETLAGWLTSPNFVAEVYRRTGLPQPASSVRRLNRVFTARKISGQLVELRFRARSEEEAHRLLTEITEVVAERTENFNEEGRASLTFAITAENPLIIPVHRSAPLRALVAAIVAFVLAANVVVFWDVLRSEGNGRELAKIP